MTTRLHYTAGAFAWLCPYLPKTDKIWAFRIFQAGVGKNNPARMRKNRRITENKGEIE
jgi:hypothetical protein